jgi:hypothetical protein
VQNYFRVVGGMKQRAVQFQFFAKFRGVGYVSVMRYRHAAFDVHYDKRLRVRPAFLPYCGIAHVPYRHIAFSQFPKRFS